MMSTPKRPLDAFFQAARNETSPITAGDVEQLITSTTPTTTPLHGASMIPSLITAAVMTLAGVGSAIIIHDDTKPVKVADRTVAAVDAPQTASPTDPSPAMQEQPTVRVKVLRATSNGAVSTDDVLTPAQALTIDLDGLRDLAIRPEALKKLAGCIGTADSVSIVNDGQQQRIIRVISSGRPQDIDFGSVLTPMPVMITLPSGHGHCLASPGSDVSPDVDPNMLVPIRPDGPGGNVMMWFSPTQIPRFPDSLRAELEELLDIDIELNEDTLRSFMQFKANDQLLLESMQNVNVDSIFAKLSHNKQFGIDKLITALHDTLHPEKLDAMLKVFISDSLPKWKTRLPFDVDSLVQRVMTNGDSAAFKIAIPDMQMRILHFDTDSAQGALGQPRTNVRVRKRIQIMRHGRGAKQIVPTVPEDGRGLQELQTASGALAITSVYPNPTIDGGATLTYTLSGDRRVQVSLHDLTGAKLMDLSAASQRKAGEGQIAFTLDGVTPGIYLVTVTTDRGERAVQRLIVQ